MERKMLTFRKGLDITRREYRKRKSTNLRIIRNK